jgi:hypothetical protein
MNFVSCFVPNELRTFSVARRILPKHLYLQPDGPRAISYMHFAYLIYKVFVAMKIQVVINGLRRF